jgi:hypothetical protein
LIDSDNDIEFEDNKDEEDNMENINIDWFGPEIWCLGV